MSSFFRSEEMNLYQFLIPRESAYNLLNESGNISMLHFIDADPQTPYFNRLFYPNIKRLEELINIIKQIDIYMKQQGVNSNLATSNSEDYIQFHKNKQNQIQYAKERYIDEIELKLQQHLKNIENNITASQEIIKQMNILIEQRACLENTENIIKMEDNICIGKIIGVINTADTARFYKLIFRSSKGNCLIVMKDIDYLDRTFLNPNNPQQEVKKSFFQLIFNTSQSRVLNDKLKRICQIFDAHIYDDIHLQSDLEQNDLQYQKSKEILALTNSQLEQLFELLLTKTDEITLLDFYYFTLIREKSIYHHLNLTKSTHSVLKALVWLPKSQEEFVFQHLHQYQEANQIPAQMHAIENTQQLTPPTKLMQNTFIFAFQEIVNTYGIPKYQEVNPGLYAIVTFPFLFGVMFGDIGHGILLLTFGILLLWKVDRNNEGEMLFRCRYLITLMGFFATFCGLIYNDFMSLPLNLFGSCYEGEEKEEGCVYKVGMDPAWLVSENNLQFYNSFKMKISIILGVSQMILGIFLKGVNAVFAKSFLDFFFEFIPQLVFMASTFGYMVILIIAKWATDYSSTGQSPPSLLNVMLNLGLKGGQIEENENLLALWGMNQASQASFQGLLLFLAFISVPLMLLPKPLWFYFKQRQEKSEYSRIKQNDDEENLISEVKKEEELKKKEDHNEYFEANQHSEEEFSEIFVHQIIESIEFVLGSISHTASYLRLWALSLAHSQLAHVFFQKTLESSIESASLVGIIIGFLIFCGVTFGVLMCMDVMECFLHTLRLHWVEFQSKFYKADGILFKPFSFLTELEVIKEQGNSN